MKAPKVSNRIKDLIKDEVLEFAMEPTKYNLNLFVEIEELCFLSYQVLKNYFETK